MPLTKRAIKKMYHDRKRTAGNEIVRKSLHKLVKAYRKHPTPKALTQVFQALDKAAKRNIIHRNHAARLKSRLSKLLKKK